MSRMKLDVPEALTEAINIKNYHVATHPMISNGSEQRHCLAATSTSCIRSHFRILKISGL